MSPEPIEVRIKHTLKVTCMCVTLDYLLQLTPYNVAVHDESIPRTGAKLVKADVNFLVSERRK